MDEPSDDPIVRRGEARQQKERQKFAYDAGSRRNKKNRNDPSNSGGPDDDNYGSMSPDEKDAYKKGFRGD